MSNVRDRFSTQNFDLSSSLKKQNSKQEAVGQKKETNDNRGGDGSAKVQNDEFEVQLSSKEKFRNLKEKYHVKKKQNSSVNIMESPIDNKNKNSTPKQLESEQKELETSQICMSYLNKTPLEVEDDGSFQNMSKASIREQAQKNQMVSVISQQPYSNNNQKNNTIDEIEQFNNELLDEEYKGNSMLNNLLEEESKGEE